MCERILVGDCTTTKPDGLFHAVLCDPPYELGFMGKDWDASGVAFHPETWRKIGEHLHPGAFLMAFASSRGWHRLACAIEDAGFIIHPTIFGWSFGSGFPKATRIDTQVDKAAGAEHLREPFTRPDFAARSNKTEQRASQVICGEKGQYTAPATPLARAWAGHRYGLQALKPAVEPIIVAQKPYSGKPVDCITRTGAGALNVDGGRIASSPEDKAAMDAKASRNPTGKTAATVPFVPGVCQPSNALGRWPANFLLLDEEAAAALDRQSGVTVSKSGGSSGTHFSAGEPGMPTPDRPRGGHNDTGGASRFFYNVQSQLDAADPIKYQAKASRRERDAGLEGLPVKEAPFRQVQSEWKSDARHPDGGYQTAPQPKARCTHPTVKPIDLARYLATLLLPPADYAPRRILVPFSGVGSEMIGAMLAGWEEVVGIERDAEYAEIARLRLAHWSANKPQAPAPEPELALEPTT